MRIALLHVNLLSMRDPQVLEDVSVVVEGNKIAYIGRMAAAGELDLAIDCQGGYLMPGLADMHVHLGNRPLGDYQVLLNLLLACGITQIREMSGSQSILTLREKVERGEIDGCHISCMSPFVEGHYAMPRKVFALRMPHRQTALWHSSGQPAMMG